MEVARYTEHFQHLKLSVKWVKGQSTVIICLGNKKIDDVDEGREKANNGEGSRLLIKWGIIELLTILICEVVILKEIIFGDI